LIANKIIFFDSFLKQSDALDRLKGMVQDAVPLNVPLPDDLLVCQGMIRELLQKLQQSNHELAGVTHRLDLLLKRLYGPKGERFDPSQPTLFDDCPSPPTPEPSEPPPEEPQTPRQKKKGHGRKKLPDHLTRKRREHDLSEAEKICPCCQQMRIRIGEEVSEVLDFVPASLFVWEQVRFKYACPGCLRKRGDEPSSEAEPNVPVNASSPSEPEGQPTDETIPPSTNELLNSSLPPSQPETGPAKLIITAPMPKMPIAKGMAGPGLLAYLIVSKYLDHLPLHRLEGIFARQGVDISRSTMCDWTAACADLLSPLYDLLKTDVLRSRVIQTDDTRVPVQDPNANRTKSGRLWVYIGDRDHPWVVYDYTPTHARDGPAAFLKGFQGFMQADAHNVYDGIYSAELFEVGCWAHGRRHFHESRDSDALRAHEALARIAGLYAVEDEAKELIAAGNLIGEAADAVRLRLRQEKTVLKLGALGQWLSEQQVLVLPKSPIGQAIAYALRHWQALTRFTEHGFLNIDNNAAERALRAVAIGRKNWLFAGSDEGGRTAAVLYTMVNTCKNLGIDAFNYLRDVLGRLPEHPADARIELLPGRWAESQRQQIITSA
jgi:transposase